jgi:outer membrane protein TolC
MMGLMSMANLQLPAQNAQLTVEQAIQKALQNRLELRAYDQRALMAERALRANQLRYVPQISAGVDARYNAILATSIVPVGRFNPLNPTDDVAAIRFGTKWANGAGLTLNQVVYDPGIKGARELAELDGQLTAAQKAQRAERVAVEVAQVYYALMITEAEVEHARSDSALAATKLADTRLRLMEGRALPTDVEAAQADSTNARLRMSDIRHNAADWRAQLAYQMGMTPDSGAGLRTSETLERLLEARQIPKGGPPAPGTAANIQALKVQQSQQLADNEKAGFKPSLMLNGFLGASHFSDAIDLWEGGKWFPTSYIGLSLNLPLTEGFIRQQRILRLNASRQADQMDLDALHNQSSLEFERAKIALAGAEDALAVQQQILALAENRLAVSQTRASEGRAIASEIALAQNQLQDARFHYHRRAYDLLLADLEMRRVCGLLRF